MNALTLLKNDHDTVEKLFKDFEGEKQPKMKRKIVDKIIKELAVHAVIEEQILYPAARKHVKQTEDKVLEALEEHHIVKWTLSELERIAPTAERFDAKVKVLMESVRHHVEEEEGELFPTLRKKMKAAELEALGAALEKAKKTAPTHPHPRSPDAPPGNLVVGLGAAIADRIGDAAKSFTSRAVKGAARAATSKGRMAAKAKRPTAKESAPTPSTRAMHGGSAKNGASAARVQNGRSARA